MKAYNIYKKMKNKVNKKITKYYNSKIPLIKSQIFQYEKFREISTFFPHQILPRLNDQSSWNFRRNI